MVIFIDVQLNVYKIGSKVSKTFDFFQLKIVVQPDIYRARLQLKRRRRFSSKSGDFCQAGAANKGF